MQLETGKYAKQPSRLTGQPPDTRVLGLRGGGYSTEERRKSVLALAFIVRSQPKRTVLVICLSLLASIAEATGIAAFLPLLGLIIDVGESNWLSEVVLGAFRFVGMEPSLSNVLLLMVGCIVAKAGLILSATQQAGFAGVIATRNLRLSLIRALLQARWSYFTHLPTGRTSHVIVTEAVRAASVYASATKILVAGIQTIVYLGLALAVSWVATLLAIVLSAIMFAVLKTLLKTVREAGRGRTVLMQSLSNRLVEAIGFFKPLKAMRLEAAVLPLLEQESISLEHEQKRIISSNALLSVYYEPLFAVLFAIGVYASKSWFEIKFFDLVALALLFYRSGSQLVKLQKSYQKMVSDESVLVLVHDLIEETRNAREKIRTGSTPTLNSSIRLKGVDFDHGQGVLLNGVDLNLPAKKITALVGPSGSGKTTILDLLSGINRPTSGKVLLDGVSLEQVDMVRWREMVGYVPQESFLFHDTIEANITLNTETITREDVEWALESAGANFIQDFPYGLDTIVGERGGRLSGGQRQRIALARALARRPALLVLDEATASLDNEAEEEIKDILSSLKGSMTIVLATHRPALLTIADRIYHLNDGVITQEKSRTRRPAKAGAGKRKR